MTSIPDKKAVQAAYVGCAAAAGYAVLKLAWGLGSTIGIRDTAAFDKFIDGTGGPLVGLWGTVLLALIAAAVLLSFVRPWGQRVPRRVRASLAWLGFAAMTPLGLFSLGYRLEAIIAGDNFRHMTPAIYLWVYGCFSTLGLTFALTAWRTRDPQAAG